MPRNRERSDRRNFLKASAAAIGTGITLSGCMSTTPNQGGGSGGGQNGSTAGNANSGGTLELLWFPGQLSDENQKALKKYFKQWENKSGWTVKTSTASQTSSLVQKAQSRYEAGNGFDLVMCPGLGMVEFAVNGYLAPLDDRIQDAPFSKDDFTSAKLIDALVNGRGSFGGKTYAVPIMSGHWGSMYYNADVFEKAGLDPKSPQKHLKTRSKMLETAKTIKNEVDIRPIGFSGADHVHTAVQFLGLYFSQGKKGVVDKNQKPIMSQKEGVETAKLYKTINDEKLFPSGVTSSNQIDMRNLLSAGQTAMYHTGSWEAPILREETDFRWGVTYLPIPSGGTHAGFAGGWGWVIAKGSNSKNQDAAWNLTRYLTTPKRQNQYAGLPPALKEGVNLRFKNFKDGLGRQVGDIFSEEISNSGFPVVHPNYASVNEAITAQVQNIILGKKSPQGAMKTLDSKISSLLSS